MSTNNSDLLSLPENPTSQPDGETTTLFTGGVSECPGRHCSTDSPRSLSSPNSLGTSGGSDCTRISNIPCLPPPLPTTNDESQSEQTANDTPISRSPLMEYDCDKDKSEEHKNTISERLRDNFETMVDQQSKLSNDENGCIENQESEVIEVTKSEIVSGQRSLMGLTSPSAGPTPEHPGWHFWRVQLRGARLVVAPMVDASELAWRLLSRRYGAELCYTPMLHSGVLVRDPRYRRDSLASCDQDRPLIAQLCGSDPTVVGEACRLVSPHCDAIDLNLGCPQAIAKKGRYGAFLMEDLHLVEALVRAAVQSSSVPITCKIRVFPCKARTVQYARRLQGAGAAVLTVHGRTRDQKGALTGLADWGYVRAVREAVQVPVFSNGNIQYHGDVWRCLKETGAQGVMTAEGNLHNPALFTPPSVFPHGAPLAWDMALEYLDLVDRHPCPISYVRGHLFKLLHRCLSLPALSDVRQTLSRCGVVAGMRAAVHTLRDRLLPYSEGRPWVPDPPSLSSLPLPPWLCQPYVRVPPEVHVRRCEEGQRRAQEARDLARETTNGKLEARDTSVELRGTNGVPDTSMQEDMRAVASKIPVTYKDDVLASEVEEDAVKPGTLKRLFHDKEADLLLLQDNCPGHLSKKKAKKLLRNPRKKFPGCTVQSFNLCVCRSPRGGKCDYQMCKACCMGRCYRDNLDCTGHRIWVMTHRHKASTLPPRPGEEKGVGRGSRWTEKRNELHSNGDAVAGTASAEVVTGQIAAEAVVAELPASQDKLVGAFILNGAGGVPAEDNNDTDANVVVGNASTEQEVMLGAPEIVKQSLLTVTAVTTQSS